MQPPGAHGFDLGGVRLHREVHDFLAGAAGEVILEGLEQVLVDRRILDRGVGKHEGGRVLQPLHVLWDVGDEVLVFVAVARVEFAAGLAVLLRVRAWDK